MTTSSEKLLSQLHPLLQQKIRQMAEALEQEGIKIVVVQGLRTWEEQDALYQQGRTKPGNIVTNAPAGHSYHNYALACDCAPENPDGSVDWNAEHPQWKHMEEVGTSLGLVSGANWTRLVDAPHFQITGAYPVSPNDELRRLYQGGGLPAVWEGLEKI